METRKRRSLQNIFTQSKQFVFKKKKRNYSIQHNFYDQKLCLNHNNYNEKPATFFEDQQLSINKADPGQKDGRTKIEENKTDIKEGQIKGRATHISTQETTTSIFPTEKWQRKTKIPSTQSKGNAGWKYSKGKALACAQTTQDSSSEGKLQDSVKTTNEYSTQKSSN